MNFILKWYISLRFFFLLEPKDKWMSIAQKSADTLPVPVLWENAYDDLCDALQGFKGLSRTLYIGTSSYDRETSCDLLEISRVDGIGISCPIAVASFSVLLFYFFNNKNGYFQRFLLLSIFNQNNEIFKDWKYLYQCLTTI